MGIEDKERNEWPEKKERTWGAVDPMDTHQVGKEEAARRSIPRRHRIILLLVLRGKFLVSQISPNPPQSTLRIDQTDIKHLNGPTEQFNLCNEAETAFFLARQLERAEPLNL
jgi:hypothetical protein